MSRGAGDSSDLGGMDSMYELWNSSKVVNDNAGGFHQASLSYMSPYQPTYKSSIVNQWQEYDIKYVCIIMFMVSLSQIAILDGKGHIQSKNSVCT